MSTADNRSSRRSQLSPAKQALLAQLKRGALAKVAQAPAIPRRAAHGAIPLSFAQQRLWFLDQLDPGSASYNMPLVRLLSGALNVAALERSLNELVRRHEILRTTFVAVDGQPQQVIQPISPVALPIVDLQAVAEAERQAQLSQAVIGEVQRPFDLARDALLRALLVRLGETEHVLVITSHHIALDGSQGILVQELVALYNASVVGVPPELPALPIQYADFAAWQRRWLQSEHFNAELDYWKRQLRPAGGDELTPLDLPIARPRPPAQTFRGARQEFKFDKSLLDAIKALSQQEDVTLFMTLLAGFQCLLSRYSGQRRIAVGTPVAQRSQPEIEHLIGCFVNTVVMSTDLSANPTFREVMQRVRQVALGAYAHQQIPIEMLIEALQLERDASRNPLYQVMFVLQHAAAEPPAFTGLTTRPFSVDAGTARLDLLLYTEVSGDQLLGMLEYNTDLFDAPTIMRLLQHFHTLLAAAVANPDQRLSELPLLPAAEREQTLVAWNATRADYDRAACMHQLFERQAARTPAATAVVCATTRLTYHELNVQANQIAHHLRAHGIGPGSMVAVWLERSHLMLPALLGILKAGAAYVPLEISFPAARVQWILNSLAARWIITQTDQLPALQAMQPDVPTLADVLCLDTAEAVETLPPAPDATAAALRLWTRAALAALPDTNPAVAVSADDLAYIIFTSGSTGTPKGVMVQHQPVTNLIEWVNHTFGIGPGDRVLFVTSLCFDLSVYDVFGLLAAGGSIRVASSQELHDPEQLLHILCTEPITFWDSAPAALNQLAPFLASAPVEGTGQLRFVFLSGDWIPVTLPDQIRGTFGQAQVISLGGATEATIWSNYFPIGPVDPQWASIPYGRPIQNAQYYILDSRLNPCPVLVPGELYIGGECLAAGYANDPVLTATKFIPDPFGQPGARLYKTGDQARFWADGTIEFLGRIDHQVKIRGFRIELGEIESVLRTHPTVQQCVVIAREDVPGDKRLVAYVVENQELRTKNQELRTKNQELRTKNQELSSAPSSRFRVPSGRLGSYLRERLPEYMVPSAFVMLETLPVTSNGKLDRRALPAPERDDLGATEALVAPRTPTEQTLLEIWTSVLRVQQIGIHDNFFMLGGDSILGIQIIARANQAGLRLAPGHLFQHQTIATLAAAAGTALSNPTEQGVVTGTVPLTPIQHWFFDQQLPAPHHWNQAMIFQVPPDLDAALMQQAAHHTLLHHDALRLRFTQTDSGWQQEHAASVEDGWFSCINLSSTAAAEQATAIQAAAELQASLNLTYGPLLRVAYFCCGADTPGRLLVIIHHLAVDGVSWRILVEDLQACYQQMARGETPALPLKTSSFKQWAERLAGHARTAAAQDTLDYWLSRPWQRVRPLPRDLRDGANTEASAATVVVGLSADETRTLLQDVPEAYRTQINEVLLTALARAFTGWSGSQSLLVNLEGHGREALFDDLDVSRTVGWFTSLYPVLLELAPTERVGPLLQAVKEQLRAIPQRGMSYGLLRYLAEPAITAQMAALPQAEVSFNYLGQFDQAQSPDTLLQRVSQALGPVHAGEGRRSHLLEINGLVAEGRLQFGWAYSTQIHHRATIERLAQAFITTLQVIINNSQTPDAASYTPSDFPLANLNQQQLSAIAARFTKRGR